MGILVNDIKVSTEEYAGGFSLRDLVASKLDIDSSEILSLEIDRKSLDARQKRNIFFNYRVVIEVSNEDALLKKGYSFCKSHKQSKDADILSKVLSSAYTFNSKPVIVGSGPSGIFAALLLVEAGCPVTVVEQGEKVEDRIKRVHELSKNGIFDAKSNYCFGEGGAGTFSDGKLTCGRKDPLIRYLFERWVEFGAPKEILYDAHPHIGSDRLISVVKNMREYIESKGGDFLFGKKFVDLDRTSNNTGYSILLDDNSRIETEYLILAIGHSARDTYRMIASKGMTVESKDFAVGCRIEHPQEVINSIQYGGAKGLPSAEYKLTARANDRGVWSFCMCPGGILLPTNGQADHLAVNGMSHYARNSGYANSALVVNVKAKDFDSDDPLAGIKYQENLEKKAFQLGGGDYSMPVQRLKDFLKGNKSRGTFDTTYRLGVKSVRFDQLLPDYISKSLHEAFGSFDRKMRGYVSDKALLVGVETKTSAPLKIVRGEDRESISHTGIFPIGEGAGYAGGIVSSALDGLKTAITILNGKAK